MAHTHNNSPGTSGNYASLNGLELYYEIHGSGKPLLLLPGALSGIGTAFGEVIPLLAATRQVIAVEFQGYAHTADVPGRPLSWEQFADDILQLLDVLNITTTDILGYSTGASVALLVAIRKPSVVGKLVVMSARYNDSGRHPDLKHLFNPETMASLLKNSPYEAEYFAYAPRPEDWEVLLEKVRDMESRCLKISEAELRSISVKTLIITGDSDIVLPEHTLSLYRLLGGGSLGELAMPTVELAILPATMHTALMQKTDLLMAIIPPFLER